MIERMSERRAEPRAPIELKVEYKRLNSFFADYTKNISRGGTFIKTDKPLDIGTEFTFHLVIPKLDKPLSLHGKVQWRVLPPDATPDQPPGMGIGFVYDTEVDRQKVEATVERLIVDSLGPVLFEKIMGRPPG